VSQITVLAPLARQDILILIPDAIDLLATLSFEVLESDRFGRWRGRSGRVFGLPIDERILALLLAVGIAVRGALGRRFALRWRRSLITRLGLDL